MKIGDKVAVVDEDLTGVITSVHQQRVTFKDDFGFTHQYPKDKLVIRNFEFYQDIETKIKPEPKKTVSKKHQKNHLVLDLHFEKLVDDPTEYESFERLFIQKEKLLETLEFCKKHRIKKLEIIHGIGDGTLQNMVVDLLTHQGNLDFRHTEILWQQSGAILVEFD